MSDIELLDIISTGETSKVQFKRDITHNDAMAAEFVAMSNSLGGIILLGVVDKIGKISGIDIQGNLNERVANIATNNVNPPIYISTEIVAMEDSNGSKKVLVIHIPEGINKPYKDNNGAIWAKQGSDKRRVTDNAEIMRFFQSSGNLLADEMPVHQASVNDINEGLFRQYFQNLKGRTIEEEGLTFEQALQVKRVTMNKNVTIGGLLFFGNSPQFFKTSFCIKAIAFFGNHMGGKDYRESIDIEGTVPKMFERAMQFFQTHLHHTQQGQSFNSIGKLEISSIALEELLQNALLHRDYFKNAPIRIAVFDNRIEIISPGKLPNSLTIEQIRHGNPVPRNSLLVNYAKDSMLFRGYGTGISRAYAEQPNIELINDVEGEQFIVKIPRPEKGN